MYSFYGRPFAAKELMFMFPTFVHKIICSLLCLLPRIFSKRYRIPAYVMTELSFIYSNNNVMGFPFFEALYPKSIMGVLCLLSIIPDCVYAFPYSVFLLEYDVAKEKRKRSGSSTQKFTWKDACSLIPGVLFRVLTNPIVWCLILGLIVSMCDWKYPLWIDSTLKFLSGSGFPVVMFNVGLFVAHSPAFKIDWSKVKAFLKRHLPCSRRPRLETDKDAELNLLPSPTSPTTTEESTTDRSSPTPSQTSPINRFADVEEQIQTEHPTSEFTPSPFPSPSPVPAILPQKPKRKVRWYAVGFWTLARHFLSPAVMLAVVYTMPFLSNPQKQAAVLVNALPLAIIAFSLSKEYEAYPSESVLLVVITTFVLVLPTFVFWQWLLNILFPFSLDTMSLIDMR
ncbi:hypothetical protein BLNAU_1269 [Blattamonas nauphoetae]|uniref:Uncharacterized protein n=1 Tax=Blattamonas nauphoetae TaxID=2049346 RepID=A0ABQ9YIX3_9EUKA|nr:hypothetical protein BLNAU_1269 [Blattamonas nauphoetae]